MEQTRSCTLYNKRKGTSGICGQLYETKLISLLYFRAIHDHRIEEFQLASNFANIGAFDDICFKAKVEGLDKPVLVFVQAKHRENEKQTLTVDLATYFDSYLKIRHTFESSNNDLLFNSAFDKTECLFVIYTTVRDEFSNETKVESSFFSKLNDLIDTGGTAKQPDKHEENVEFLSKIAMKDQITSLAERMAELIMGEENLQMMSELVLRYHVILAQKVVDVSEIKPDGQRIAFFRDAFFDSNEEYLILLKDTLYKEILKRRKIKPADVTNLLSEFLASPTDTTSLSKLIGTVITYNNGQLELLKKSTKDVNQQLNKVYVSRLTVNQAVELAAKEILSSQEFKVPAAFGNKDITIRGNDAKIEKRMNHITSKIKDLFNNCKFNNIVTIDDSIEKGLQQLNGGIAGAIGNIFVLDDDTKLMKLTDKCESLGDLAKRLYKKIIEEIHNLHEYKFRFKIYKFPKLSFDRSDYEENLAKDFLNKLLYYSSQSNENDVEKILKSEIEDYQRDHANYFQAKTDAIFSKYHDDIQKWWMQPNAAVYLTKEINRFENAIHNIIKDPLMSLINVTYMSKIKHFKYTFNEEAVKSLKLQDQLSTTVIITENSVLTVVKVMQYLKDKEHTVLDLEYIVDLPTNDRNALSRELKNTNEDNVLIIVCDKIPTPRHQKKTLKNIIKAIQDKKTIVITNKMSLAVIKAYFPTADNIVHDEKSTLIDMSEESQKTILESTRLIFQGKEVKLSLIVDGETMACVKGDVLIKIVSKEIIEVSDLIVNRNYEEIKHLYVDRSVTKAGRDRVIVRTLYDIADDFVLVTAEPGMGKSTLLTHLSLKTKEVDPQVWIVTINLLEYSREFNKWKEDETTIDTLETLKFMCQVILRRKLGKENKVEIALEEQNNVVYLKNCTGDQWTVFELKLFLNFYNKGKMIFLFDGFDEVCPHYMNEVINCIKTFSNNPRKPRMWITSRSYNEVKNILQREFGSSYEIDYFSYTEMEKYLETFWEFNLRLEEFNTIQLENVKNFIEDIISKLDVKVNAFVIPLHRVYINAAHYLINEIKYKFIPLWTYKKIYNDSMIRSYVEACKICIESDRPNFYRDGNVNGKSDGNPLHLLLAAVFVEGNLKNITKKSEKWNLEVNSFAFCEWFLENMMKKRFQEKNEMNIYNPDIINAYDKELSDFILRHKKLAAYAIFNQHSLKLLFSTKDLEEIKESIKLIEKGGEKTGLIYSVANEIPIFIHMTFTEYLAVEYVCDCMKNEKKKKKKKTKTISWMELLLNVILSLPNFSYMRGILDHRIKADKTLMSILENNKEVIFNLLTDNVYNINTCTTSRVEQVPFQSQDETFNKYLFSWILRTALFEELHNVVLFFVKILECYIKKNNLNEFLDLFKKRKLLSIAKLKKNNVFIIFVLDIVKKIDKSKFTSVLKDNFRFQSENGAETDITNYVELSSQELIDSILICHIREPAPLVMTGHFSSMAYYNRVVAPINDRLSFFDNFK